MDFNKEKFSEILTKIKDSYGSINQMADKSEVTAAYLSKLIRLMYDNAPSPEILKKIADNSKGIVTYNELMQICGYSEESIENTVYYIYEQMKELSKKIYTEGKEDFYEAEGTIEHFQDYTADLIKSIETKKGSRIYLTEYFNTDHIFEDYNFVCNFLLLYDNFLKCLAQKQYVTITDYEYTNWFDMNEIYTRIKDFENWELLSYMSFKITINAEHSKDLIIYTKKFSTALKLAYLSDFDNNALIELFKSKAKSANNKEETSVYEYSNKTENQSDLRVCEDPAEYNFSDMAQFYMCPVYGQISAGQPNWAEECIEGRIPLDPVMFGIDNPEECFFLRVNGESMNKIVKNNGFALIHKQDTAENGDIVAVLVNGYDATLKKFTKHENVVVLEPMSNDTTFETQIYNEKTEIKILGKYIGKFEMNK